MPNHITPHGPVAPHVERPNIVRLGTHVEYLIRFDQVIVTPQLNRIMRPVMNQVMQNTIAHTIDTDRRTISKTRSAVVMNMIVPGKIVRWHKRLPVAP